MKLFYNNIDIYQDVSVNYCVHEMFAEKQADTLTIRFNDPKGIWSKWQPASGDTVRFVHDAIDSGVMWVKSFLSENGLFTVRASSLPKTAKLKRSKSWENIHFLQLVREIAGNHGLSYTVYGCKDYLYPYIDQNNQNDFAFLSTLAELEGCQILVFNGSLIVYNEKTLEEISPQTKITINQNGHFFYNDDRDFLFGSCQMVGGSYSGLFTADSSNPSVLRKSSPFRLTGQAQAERFAQGALRQANKNSINGKFSRELTPELAPGSVVELKTDKASAWNGKAFIRRLRHDYVKNQSMIYFRGTLEGY